MEYTASRQRSGLSSNGGFCGMIVPLVNSRLRNLVLAHERSGSKPPGTGEEVAGLGRPLFAFEFESITHSIGRIRVVSETSGPLRYRLPRPSWVHKISAPAFGAEAAVVPFIS